MSTYGSWVPSKSFSQFCSAVGSAIATAIYNYKSKYMSEWLYNIDKIYILSTFNKKSLFSVCEIFLKLALVLIYVNVNLRRNPTINSLEVRLILFSQETLQFRVY